MKGARRFLLAALVVFFGSLASPSSSRADWQNPVGVCMDSRGCESSPSPSYSPSYSQGSGAPWGGSTKATIAKIERCRDFMCAILGTAITLPISLLIDAPYYAVKGVGNGLYYGGKGLGKGLYYGGKGLGKGIAYTGRAIGRGIAYPFNRPEKPKLPPTTWEQYKHDVLKHQKKLAKTSKAHKETRKWCVKNVPLEVSPNRARWEDLCNGGGAVSRASLPILAAPAAIDEIVAVPKPGSPEAPVSVAPSAEASSIPPEAPAAVAPSAEASSVPPEAPAAADPALQDPEKALAGGEGNAKSAAEGGFDSGEKMLGGQETVQLDPKSSPPIPPTIPPSAPPAPFIEGGPPAPPLLGSAPDFPASFGTPEEVGAMLAPDVRPATPEAFEYLGRAAKYIGQRGLDHTREVATKTAKEAISAEFAPATVLINMFELPEAILPNILKAAKGDLSAAEADLLLFKSVNILYNFGAAPNKLLASIIEKQDGMQGLLAYGADEASDKLSLSLGRGISRLAAEKYSQARYPKVEVLDGTVPGRVQSTLREGARHLTEKDIRRGVVLAKDMTKEIIGASKAIVGDEPAAARP